MVFLPFCGVIVGCQMDLRHVYGSDPPLPFLKMWVPFQNIVIAALPVREFSTTHIYVNIIATLKMPVYVYSLLDCITLLATHQLK